MIKATASVLINQTKRSDRAHGFIGHIGGDDFIIVVPYDAAEPLAQRIIADFDVISPSFYTGEDRKRGYLVSADRQGNEQRFPFISISIGIVHNRLRKLTSLAQISQIGSELKHYAKSAPKSSYVIDRRS